MKIALSLSGYLNSTRDKSSHGIDGFDHIKNKILDNNDVDVYIHSWDIPNQNLIENMYKDWIKDCKFEKQIDFMPVFYANKLDQIRHNPGYNHFSNVFSQYYSIQESFRLIKHEYDIVIRARFDLGRVNRNTSGPFSKNNPYAVQCINLDTKLDMSKVYMAKWQQDYLDNEGPADMWFYSGWDNMKHFCNLYDILSSDIRHDSSYAEWAINSSTNPWVLNSIKGWKWFFIKTGLWDKKFLLTSEWE